MRGLAELEFLPNEDAGDLETAYRFLAAGRTSSADRGRTANPHRPGKWRSAPSLARSLGFDGGRRSVFEPARADAPSARDFPAGRGRRVDRRRIRVRSNLQSFATKGRRQKTSRSSARGRPGFHVAPRTRQIFRKLRPLLLTWLGRAADPDATLTQFVRFVEAYGFRSLLFELLTANPRLLELLVQNSGRQRDGGRLVDPPSAMARGADPERDARSHL